MTGLSRGILARKSEQIDNALCEKRSIWPDHGHGRRRWLVARRTTKLIAAAASMTVQRKDHILCAGTKQERCMVGVYLAPGQEVVKTDLPPRCCRLVFRYSMSLTRAGIEQRAVALWPVNKATQVVHLKADMHAYQACLELRVGLRGKSSMRFRELAIGEPLGGSTNCEAPHAASMRRSIIGVSIPGNTESCCPDWYRVCRTAGWNAVGDLSKPLA